MRHRLQYDKCPAMYEDTYRIPGIIHPGEAPRRCAREFVSPLDRNG